MRRLLIALLLITVIMAAAGCGNKNSATVNQDIKTLTEGYQQSMVTYFDIKGIQDNAVLTNQINDNLKKIEDSKVKLEKLSGINETVTDPKIKAEISTFIDLGRAREKLALKYLNDIRKDMDYRYSNPDAQININAYITSIPDDLLDYEYRSEQSVNRLNQLMK
ncbi:MAG: hypothetical protein ACOY31_11335 [Bacillota bacterium]